MELLTNLKHGEDFWLAYLPERVDPGNINFHTKNTPKIIGAITEDGLEIGMKIYSKVIDTLHPVSSPRVAEMVKILENNLYVNSGFQGGQYARNRGSICSRIARLNML